MTFTKGLAEEVIKRGIRANVVAPGPVWTPLIVQSFDKEKIEKFGKDSPMKRPAQPAELAPAFVFLASNESSYVNGEVLGVTGGKPIGCTFARSSLAKATPETCLRAQKALASTSSRP